MSYQEEGMSNPSKAAEYCLTRLHKLAQAGARRIPPLHVEINAVEVIFQNVCEKAPSALMSFYSTTQ